MQTCILDRLSGPLCDAVVERQGSQTVLEKLEQANLFLVPLDQHRQWYRYHHLELRTVLRWLDALPQDQVRSDPQLSMMYAWGLLATSHMDVVEPRLQDIERVLGVVADGLEPQDFE